MTSLFCLLVAMSDNQLKNNQQTKFINVKIIKIMTEFRELVSKLTLAASSKAAKMLKNGTGTDLELANAVKTTKAYKEDPFLAAKVATVIARETQTPKEEVPFSKSTKHAEPPRW